jgi:hypothetical protein
MDLKQRLSSLRRQSGGEAVDSARAERPAIAERIQRLRPAVSGPEHRGGCPAMTDPSLAEQLGGQLVADGLIQVTRRIGLDGHHGRVALCGLSHRVATLPEPEDGAPERWLMIDTETSGLSGGAGTLVFLLGLARIEAGWLETRQYLLTAFAGEPALFRQAGDWAGRGRTLLSFNGKCFDLPLLAARARLARVADPFAGLAHLDLLHPTRRLFAGRWPDCRLATAERQLLEFVREDDLPGSEAPQVWLDWIRRRDASRMGAVLRHNYWDLVSLAALALRLGEASHAPGRWGADPLAAARSWLARGQEQRALALLESHRRGLGTAGLLELARLYRRSGQWVQACTIWSDLAGQGEAAAAEELAKYHEHVARDLELAMSYASRLGEAPEHSHRRRRLARKLAERGSTGTLL